MTGYETNWREFRYLSQLPVQVLPLNLGQQVSFIQHEENSVCRKYWRNKSGTEGKCFVTGPSVNTQITLGQFDLALMPMTLRLMH